MCVSSNNGGQHNEDVLIRIVELLLRAGGLPPRDVWISIGASPEIGFVDVVTEQETSDVIEQR